MSLTWAFSCGAAGIEPSPKILPTCGNIEFDDAKQRERTRIDLGIRESR